MKIELHKAEQRGGVNLGWLNSQHTFSFGSYYNPNRMGFGKLRVLNDDVIAPSTGFDTHPHENMEIVSIPMHGELRHKDSMNNVALIRSGEVQIMSAGSGVTHSEYNNSEQEDAKFLQIWVEPNVQNQQPGYQQKEFPIEDRKDRWQLLVSPDSSDGSLRIKQEARFSLLKAEKGGEYSYALNDPSNGVYLFLLEGSATVGDVALSARDGAAITSTDIVALNIASNSELLAIEVCL